MDIINFYNENASEQWFKRESKRGSVHGNLRQRGFSVVDRQSLSSDYSRIAIPVERGWLSWGGSVPRPPRGWRTAFVAAYPHELKEMVYHGESYEILIDRWMGLLPCATRYLASLEESNYLFSVADRVTVADVHEVTGKWDLEAFVGVFDESNTMVFVFDGEFGCIYMSCVTERMPDGFEEFANIVNAEFQEVFVRDAKLRTGADPARAEEYFRVALEPAI